MHSGFVSTFLIKLITYVIWSFCQHLRLVSWLVYLSILSLKQIERLLLCVDFLLLKTQLRTIFCISALTLGGRWSFAVVRGWFQFWQVFFAVHECFVVYPTKLVTLPNCPIKTLFTIIISRAVVHAFHSFFLLRRLAFVLSVPSLCSFLNLFSFFILFGLS